MPHLPQFQDDSQPFQMMQNQWAAIINPILDKSTLPQANFIVLKSVPLLAASNPNVVNHKLGRKPVGYRIIRQRASSIVWDNQDSNPNPITSFYFRCSADVTVDLEIF